MSRTLRHNLPGKIVLLLVLVLGHGPVNAQDLLWSVNYGGEYSEEGYSGVRTSDGGYAVLGSTYSFGAGDHDILVLRLDSLGDTLWSNTFGGPGTERGYDILQTDDEGFIVVGTTHSFGAGDYDVYLLKLNFMGGLVWSKTFGGAGKEVGRSVRQTSDDGFIIGGSTNSYGAGYEDVYLIKTNSAGDTLWTSTYGGAGGESAFGVRATPDGGYVACGATGSFGEGYSSMYVVKTNSEGDTLWTNTFGGASADMGYAVEISNDGGLVFVGATASYGAGEYDIYLVKTGPDGVFEWQQTYGGGNSDRGFSVRPLADGGFLVAGTTASYGAGMFDAIAVRTNPIGMVDWQRTYGGPKSDYCQASLTDNNSWVLIGHTFSDGAGASDLFIVKISALGATDVDDDPSELLPEEFVLEQNYPNPFNLSTTIEYSLSRRADVTFSIFNILGQVVRQWSPGSQSAGRHSISWDGHDSFGREVASGVYLYSLDYGTVHQARKMILLK